MTSYGRPSGDCTPEHLPVRDGDHELSEGHVKIIETPPCEDCETGDEHVTIATPTSCEGKHCDVVNPPVCEGEGCPTGDERTQTVTPPCKGEHCKPDNKSAQAATPPTCKDDCEVSDGHVKIVTPLYSGVDCGDKSERLIHLSKPVY